MAGSRDFQFLSLELRDANNKINPEAKLYLALVIFDLA